jgi:hypothetical protein
MIIKMGEQQHNTPKIISFIVCHRPIIILTTPRPFCLLGYYPENMGERIFEKFLVRVHALLYAYTPYPVIFSFHIN